MSEVDISDIEQAREPGFIRWNGSPAVMLPDRSKRVRYSRPSGAGKLLDDTTALDKWKIRTALLGAANDKSIIPQVVAANGDKKVLNAIADTALEKGNVKVGADWGTALHTMTEQLDRGERSLDEFPEEQRQRMVEYHECLGRYGLKPILEYIEVGIVQDVLRFAGTADRIMEATLEIETPHGPPIMPGDLVGCDVKTNSSDLKFALLGYEIQSALYFGRDSQLYDTEAEIRSPMPDGLRRDWGFIIHLPSDGEGCDLVWLDLERGQRGAELSRMVKDWRAEKIEVRSPSPDLQVGNASDGATLPDDMPTELDVECPKCSAEIGAHCVTPSGTKAKTHAARHERWNQIANVPAPKPEPTPPPVDETIAWIKDRIAVLKGIDGAVDTLLMIWPKDLPGLKAGGHTPEQIEQLDKLVASIEAQYGTQFIPGPQAEPVPRENSILPAVERTPYVETVKADIVPADPSAPADPKALEAIAARVAKLNDEQRKAVLVAKQSAAGTLKLADATILTFEHWCALLTWVEINHTVAWAATFSMLGYDTLDVTLLDIESARAMTEIGLQYVEGWLALDATGTSLVPTSETKEPK